MKAHDRDIIKAAKLFKDHYADWLLGLCTILLAGDESTAVAVVRETLARALEEGQTYPDNEDFPLRQRLRELAAEECDKRQHEKKITQAADIAAMSQTEQTDYRELLPYLDLISEINRKSWALFWSGMSYADQDREYVRNPGTSRQQGSRAQRELMRLKAEDKRSQHE